MAGNETLSARNGAALDEWYTQLTDIEAELRHYRDQFKGKVVFCNCDGPYESNFFKYFAMNFSHLGLKRLITTCYAGSPISGQQLPLLETAGLRDAKPPREPYMVVISEVPDPARVKVVVAFFMQPAAVFLMLPNAFERSSRVRG